MDRDKVIKGLGIVSRMLNEMGRRNEMDIVDDAITLLKEQEDLNKALVDQCDRIRRLVIELAEQPQIVRCKDCKHYEYGYGCKLWHTLYNQNDDWFCADGERKAE